MRDISPFVQLFIMVSPQPVPVGSSREVSGHGIWGFAPPHLPSHGCCQPAACGYPCSHKEEETLRDKRAKIPYS